MQIAVVGALSRTLCRAAGVDADAFPTLRDASGRAWDLLALSRSAVPPRFSGALSARSLILPGDCCASLALCTGARQVVDYGLSPRDTLTISSLTGTERLFCLQRSIVALNGVLLEPQELPFSSALAVFSDEDALLIACLRLLCDPAPQ